MSKQKRDNQMKICQKCFDSTQETDHENIENDPNILYFVQVSRQIKTKQCTCSMCNDNLNGSAYLSKFVWFRNKNGDRQF